MKKRLGAGGMAEVWQAEDDLGRAVAIKLIYPDREADPQVRAMLRDELEILRQVHHPNVVRVVELGEDSGRIWMVMELLEGCSLHALELRLKRSGQRFPASACALVGLCVAEGLVAVHEARGADQRSLRIVHRDIAPNNVMVGRDGSVTVIDFGVARARSRATRTSAGVIKGRIGYMAPEQAMGAPVTGKADVFALGVVLWEMMAMRRLFPSKGTLLHVVQRPEPPSLQPFGAPPDLDALILSMMCLQEEDRPTMSEVVQGLGQSIRLHFKSQHAVHSAFQTWVRQIMEGPGRRPATARMPGWDPTPSAAKTLPMGDDWASAAPEPNDLRPAVTVGMDPSDVHRVDLGANFHPEAPAPCPPSTPTWEDLSSSTFGASGPGSATDGFRSTSGPGESVDLVVPQEMTSPHDASALQGEPETQGPPLVPGRVPPMEDRPPERLAQELRRLQQVFRAQAQWMGGLVLAQSAVILALVYFLFTR